MKTEITNINKCHVIVIGNEKGGAGKTTTTMHLIISLLSLGFRVGSIDVDSRQGSLTRYIENRAQYSLQHNINFPSPIHYIIKNSDDDSKIKQQLEESSNFENIFNELYNKCDFIVIDTPGSYNFLSCLAHSYADTIITPMNDSFVDLDVLARIKGDDHTIEKPSIYAQMIWEQKMQKAKRDGSGINWYVMRNRLSNLRAKNKLNIEKVLNKLGSRIGFKHISGFSERVIFRELFLQGLTLLDMHNKSSSNMNLSHIAARLELKRFLDNLGIAIISERIKTFGNTPLSTKNVMQESLETSH
jgi:chromosome partitioning protein